MIKIKKTVLVDLIKEAMGTSVASGAMSTALSIPAVGAYGKHEDEEEKLAEPKEGEPGSGATLAGDADLAGKGEKDMPSDEGGVGAAGGDEEEK